MDDFDVMDDLVNEVEDFSLETEEEEYEVEVSNEESEETEVEDDCKNDDDEDEEEDDEEIEDPQAILKEECAKGHGCPALMAKLEACASRVSAKEGTQETCLEELQDFVHCVDHCVAHSLFTKLK